MNFFLFVYLLRFTKLHGRVNTTAHSANFCGSVTVPSSMRDTCRCYRSNLFSGEKFLTYSRSILDFLCLLGLEDKRKLRSNPGYIKINLRSNLTCNMDYNRRNYTYKLTHGFFSSQGKSPANPDLKDSPDDINLQNNINKINATGI